MNKFISTLKNYIQYVSDENDKKILNEAVQLYNTEPLITDVEYDVLNEIFNSLRVDDTIEIIQDPSNLDFCIALKKQEVPIIQNKHDIMTILNELKRISTNNRAEQLVINFLCSCEHVEQTEVFLVQNIVKYLGNSWNLKPFENIKYYDENIKISRLVPTYSKKLIKKYSTVID